MSSTRPVRLMTDAELTAQGWAAWSRDADGLLCTSHASFESISEWQNYVADEALAGNRVYYPDGPLKLCHGMHAVQS